jgi:hypothetical protein
VCVDLPIQFNVAIIIWQRRPASTNHGSDFCWHPDDAQDGEDTEEIDGDYQQEEKPPAAASWNLTRIIIQYGQYWLCLASAATERGDHYLMSRLRCCWWWKYESTLTSLQDSDERWACSLQDLPCVSVAVVMEHQSSEDKDDRFACRGGF